MHRLRFGVVGHPAADGHTWAEKYRRVESLGYDTLLMVDSLGFNFATGSALAAASMATTTLRIGTISL